MYILYYKQMHIVKEPILKNCTAQTWRRKQLAMCEEEKPLRDWINQQKHPERYYVEKQPDR